MKFLIVACATILAMMGCTTNISPQAYSVGSVGQVNRTVSGIVISVRMVDITGTSRIGGGAGTAAGAVIGSGSGDSSRGNVVGAIGGAVIGGIAGAAIEANATKQKGVEYVVETDNRNLMTIVQGADTVFEVGEKVLVLYGAPSRLIADPRAKP